MCVATWHLSISKVPDAKRIAMLANTLRLFLQIVVLFCWLLLFAASSSSSTGEETRREENVDETCAGQPSTGQSTSPVCQDMSEECPKWAVDGRCRREPDVMRACAVSCGVCFRVPSPDEESDAILGAGKDGADVDGYEEDEDEEKEDDEQVSCEDLHESCQQWAEAGECMLNPKYMKSACRLSCFLCPDPNEKNPDVARRKIVFSKMDCGPDQYIPMDGEEVQRANVQHVIRAMETYAKTKATRKSMNAVRRHCKNHDSKCALWASSGDCTEKPAFMMETCPLACRSCHHLDQFIRCAARRDSNNTKAFKPQSILDKFEDMKDAYKGEFRAEVVSRRNDARTNNNSWVLQLDGFLSEKECDHLVEIANTRGWRLRQDSNSGEYHRHEFSTALCDDSCEKDSVYETVLERISLVTGAPRAHFEYVQFEFYERAQSHGPRHDYLAHDAWKPSGPRVLTFLLSLSEAKEGGANGFPGLDWLSTVPKRGQALLWPNVMRDDVISKNPEMVNECLPVVQGEKLVAIVWIHAFDWRNEFDHDCT